MNTIIKGITTIRWGTAAQSVIASTGVGAIAPATQANFASAIVTKVSFARQGGAPIVIEDGAGFGSIWVGINDGDLADIEIVDDTSITMPAFGDTLILRKTGDAANKNFICEDNNPSLERKKEGTRMIKARYYANIAVS